MPVVQMPDGRVIEFPDSMTSDQINNVLEQQQPLPAATPANQAAASAYIQSHTGINPADAAGYGFGRSLLSGLTLGHEPEVMGAIDTLDSSSPLSAAAETYPAAVARERAAQSAYGLTNPAGMQLGQELGAVAPTALALSGVGAGADALLGTSGLTSMTDPGLAFLAGRSEGPLVLRAASGATQGAIQGGEVGLLQHNLGPDPSYGEIGPGIAANTAFGVLSPFVRAAFTPTIAPSIARTALAGSDLGVDTTLPQLVQTGRAGVRPGGSTDQLSQFTRALSRTMGGDTPVLDESAMSDIRDKLSAGYQQVIPRINVPSNEPQLAANLGQIDAQAMQRFRGNPSALAKVQGQIDNVRDALNSGISGQVFQEMTGYSGDITQLTNNPETKVIGIKLRQALNDAVERNAAPEDAATLNDLNGKWLNMSVLDPVVSKTLPSGVVNPRLVAPAVQSAVGDYAFGGGGDLATLGKIGALLPPSLPTGEAKSVGHGLRNLLLGGLGATIGMAEGPEALNLAMEHPQAAMGAAALGTAALTARKLYGAATGSQWWRNMMLNNVLAPPRGGVPNALVSPLTQAPNALWPGQP